jgi:hypothetical protein
MLPLQPVVAGVRGSHLSLPRLQRISGCLRPNAVTMEDLGSVREARLQSSAGTENEAGWRARIDDPLTFMFGE